MAISNVKALTFDVFGTVVDWRSSLIREGEALGKAKGLSLDWAKFADSWRGLYQPAMDEVRSGRRPWTKLDDLHRESLDKLLAQFGIKGLSEAEIDHFNRAWHRLDPWPDSVPRAHAPEAEVRAGHALERQRGPHGEHGQVRRASVGRGPRRR